MRWLVGLVALFTLPSGAALAATEPSETTTSDEPSVFQDHQSLSDADMDMLRGGFELQGVSISLGAQMTTYLNGQLVMATTMNWSTSGANAPASTITLTPASTTALQSVVASAGALSSSSSSGAAYITNNGQTMLYHNTINGLQNVLVNTASGVNATQTINATIGISGYSGYSSANLAASLGHTLGVAVAIAGIH